MRNELQIHQEQRIIAFSLAFPGLGSRRISAELARDKWGGLRISEHGVWRVFSRYGLNTRTKRLSLVAGYAARYERKPDPPEEDRHIDAERPGEVVGVDCFRIERLQQTILEECWRPSFARSLVPKLTALERDLEAYLWTYNYDCAHTGRLTRGQIPADIVYGAHKVRPAR